MQVIDINEELLRAWPLPLPPSEGDKEDRGRTLIVGGSRELVGAVTLAAEAVLRAGAGKVTVMTLESVCHTVAIAVPEARVIGMQQTSGGALRLRSDDDFSKPFDAVLIGPGMQDEAATCEFVRALLPRLITRKVILDATAMAVVREPGIFSRPVTSSVLLTPHAGELAHLSGEAKEDIARHPASSARTAARRWDAIVALKGATTYIVAPDDRKWRHDAGNAGLAVSGSGDTLAGIIAGLAARGAPLEQAAAWGVALHARAGEVLTRRFGPIGYLPRELAREIPALMHALSAQ